MRHRGEERLRVGVASPGGRGSGGGEIIAHVEVVINFAIE